MVVYFKLFVFSCCGYSCQSSQSSMLNLDCLHHDLSAGILSKGKPAFINTTELNKSGLMTADMRIFSTNGMQPMQTT
jgi:hypothetical protein